jgi:hypothetical protein
VASAGVDTQGDPAEDSVLNGIAKQSILEERIRVGVCSLDLDDMVIRILGDGDGVLVVRRGSLHLGDEVLVEEKLAYMRDLSTSESVVGQNMSLGVGNNMDVGGTARVVTREEGIELGHALRVSLLDSTGKRLVQIGCVVAVSIHAALDAGVDAGGVTVPYIPVEVLDRLTGVDVDKLGVKDQLNSWLVVTNVLPNQLSADPEGADFSFRGEDASGVRVEELTTLSRSRERTVRFLFASTTAARRALARSLIPRLSR